MLELVTGVGSYSTHTHIHCKINAPPVSFGICSQIVILVILYRNSDLFNLPFFPSLLDLSFLNLKILNNRIKEEKKRNFSREEKKKR